MLEREFMNNWVKSALEGNPNRYWLRIPDSASGIKPFDGVLWLADGRSLAIEFKVWRSGKKFDYSTVEPHQMRALLEFQLKGDPMAQRPAREAKIIVLFERTGKVKMYPPSQKILDKMLGIVR